MIEIREARPGDAPAIAIAHVEGWRAAYRGFVADDFLDHPDFLRVRSRGFSERHGWTCGSGDDVVIETWEGPTTAGLPPLERPLHNVRYRIDLR